MGDPRKPRKKFSTPRHPWEKERIEDEAKITREYGLKNKKEIQKMNSVLKNLKTQAKRYITATSKQAEKEKEQLIQRIIRMGLATGEVTMDNILGLTVEAIMERRLQTILFRKGLAQSMGQSRQMIVHRHVSLGNKKITSPSTLVTKEEEATLKFHDTSSFNDSEHPERPKEKATPGAA